MDIDITPENVYEAFESLSKIDIDSLKKKLEQEEVDKLFKNNRMELLSNSQYEIVIAVTANLLERNEGDAFGEAKEISTSNFHIPVPSGQDHHAYLKAFLDFLQNCLSGSANQSS